MRFIHDHRKLTLDQLRGTDALVYVHGYQFKVSLSNVFGRLITVTDEAGEQTTFCTIAATKQFLEGRFRETLGQRK